MAIDSNKFRSNSLTGAVKVSGGFANIALPTAFYALEGNISFNILVRTGSTEGPVIYTSPVVTLRDNSSFVSLTANTATVNEGDLVAFTLVTANAVGNSTLYYSVFPVTANVTAGDFTANTGSFSLTNNAGTFALKANADLSLVNEAGENFRVQLRTVSSTGNVVFTTSNIAIQDTSNAYNVLSFVSNATSPIVEGSNVTFTFTAINVPFGTLFYYNTSGNVTSFLSNTGSFVMNGVSNTFVITNPQLPFGTTKSFNAIVRSDSAAGPIIATSNTINVLDESLVTLSATGGVQSNVEGYRIHSFTTSSDITFSNPGRVEYLIVAGGGGGSAGVNSPDSPDPGAKGAGGGAGGLLGNIFASAQVTGGTPYSILIGGGGSGGAGNHPFFNPSLFAPQSAGFRGSNTSALGFVAVGGGAAQAGGYYGGGGGPTSFNSPQGGAGGSGGGGATTQGNLPGRAIIYGGDSITGQGNPGGGNSPFSSFSGTGYGGGAGTAGGSQYGGGSPPFGEGIYSNISGTNSYYASGGAVGPGPWFSPASEPLSGTTNTGSGGRGGSNSGGPSGTSLGGGSGGSGIVVIRYRANAAAFVNITTPANFVFEGSNIVFTMNTTDLSNNTLLYYYTVGNVLSSHFVTGNIGSFRSTLNSTTITLSTNSTIPTNEERFFQLRITGDAGTSQDPLITSNVFTVKDTALEPKTSSIEYLVVAGGGGGGWMLAGGGGAGGYRTATGYPVSSGSPITVTVGAGGAGNNGTPNSFNGTAGGYTGSPGSNSVFGSITSTGGGGGGSYNSVSLIGASGGSGGGAGTGDSAFPSVSGGAGNTPPTSPAQGNAGGGTTASPKYGSGGGGGAGAVGGPGATASGSGGIGLQSSISGTATYYAGGGGGGTYYAFGGSRGFGGDGGGGNGGTDSSGSSGTVNTGGGGGGSGWSGGSGGGIGGSGIVVIRYPDTFATATTTGSPNVIYANANIIYRFWQSGTITFP
jgi:hypothetical protein